MERKQIEIYKIKFDDIIHELDGVEFWYARELMSHLGYERWENFNNAIGRAMEACISSGIEVTDHFREVTKMISLGRSMLGERSIKPEELPLAEDMKKLERRVKSTGKRIAKESGILPEKEN